MRGRALYLGKGLRHKAKTCEKEIDEGSAMKEATPFLVDPLRLLFLYFLI